MWLDEMLTCVAAAPVVRTVFSVDIGSPTTSFEICVVLPGSAMIIDMKDQAERFVSGRGFFQDFLDKVFGDGTMRVGIATSSTDVLLRVRKSTEVCI